MCISKGKAHKRYEFGQKVSVTTTNRGDWIVGVNLCRGNPCDGHTLAKAIATTEQITRVGITDVFIDRGDRGNDYKGSATIHISGSSSRRLTRTQKKRRKRRKRRSAVQPKIGHLKTDNRMGRCFPKGLTGDSINTVLAAAGSDLQKLLLRAIAHALFSWLWSRLTGPEMARFGPSYSVVTAS
jgi:IS5 family transposase